MHENESHNFQKTRAEINLTSVQLLLTDMDVALTFISIAEDGGSQDKVERNMRNARKAYDSVQHLRSRFYFTEGETATLDAKLAELRKRLEALGETF